MSKKDYELLASTIASCSTWPDFQWDAVKMLAFRLCESLEVDNPKFDRARFLNACGIH